MVRYLINKPGGKLNPTDMLLAKKILKFKCLVGLYDELEASMAKFALYFGWSRDNASQVARCRAAVVAKGDKNVLGHPISTRHENDMMTSMHAIKMGSVEWRAIARQNRFDLELFEYAKRIYKVQGEQIFDLVGHNADSPRVEGNQFLKKRNTQSMEGETHVGTFSENSVGDQRVVVMTDALAMHLEGSDALEEDEKFANGGAEEGGMSDGTAESDGNAQDISDSDGSIKSDTAPQPEQAVVKSDGNTQDLSDLGGSIKGATTLQSEQAEGETDINIQVKESDRSAQEVVADSDRSMEGDTVLQKEQGKMKSEENTQVMSDPDGSMKGAMTLQTEQVEGEPNMNVQENESDGNTQVVSDTDHSMEVAGQERRGF